LYNLNQKSASLQVPNYSEQRPQLGKKHSSDQTDSELSTIYRQDSDEDLALDLPDYKNWYEEGAVSVPGDQRNCGSCWAFSTAAALESLAYIKGFDKEVQTYSVQQLVDCDLENFGCRGGWMLEGFNYAKENGILLEKDYELSYNAKQNSCHLDGNEYAQERLHFFPTSYIENDKRTNLQLKILL
jgi:C1A family cysteine protease